MLPGRRVFQTVWLIVSICLVSKSLLAQEILRASGKALKVLDEITIRVTLEGGREGPGVLFDASGVVLVHTAELGANTSTSIMLPDGSKVGCKLLCQDSEIGVALIVISNPSDVPKMNYLAVRDPSTMQETEVLVTRSYAREGFLYTRVGSLAFLSTKDTDSSLMIIQMPLADFSAGAPLLDADGKLAGYLCGTINIEADKIYLAYPFTAVSKSLSKQPEYSNAYNSTFNGVTFKGDSLTVMQTNNATNLPVEKGSEIVTVNDLAVKNIHDLKMACWIAKVREQDSLELGIRKGNQDRVHQVRLK